jgi:AraC-like DNA-binding protein
MIGGEATYRFSTEELPARDRIAVVRESFGRELFRLDIEPLAGDQFFVELTGQTFPGLQIFAASTSPIRCGRTRELATDGDDRLCILQMSGAAGMVSVRGQDVTIGPHEMLALSRADVSDIVFPSQCNFVSMHVPRAALGPLLRNCDDVLMSPIPAQSEARRLLAHFISVTPDPSKMSSDLRRLSVNYIYDLLALALGATEDAAEVAEGRGLRAARLRAIKDDILANLHKPNLTIAAVARRHRVTPRYVQMLFESEGTYSQFVLHERLARARSVLANPAYVTLPIGTIAYDAGFSDLSHFNHGFRRVYGMSPSDVRAAARRRLCAR